ncbi:2-C-methyl-D-erythritol 4-phosphate cytidylyltransferase [Clostridium sp. CAG:914]|nr:2-C-methyl-D-erythritol 4-phosphate cytidylyltransferase [Clostridium sp. CAG:914]
MKKIALIFAGGTGTRMKKQVPKQFLEIGKKAIIVRTIEVFEKCDDIDEIYVSCIEDWIDYLKELLEKANIKKVVRIVPGGKTGQLSIFNGLKAAYEKNKNEDDTIVLIHDGVRPFIDEDLIKRNINCVIENGCAISCAPAIETILLTDKKGEVNSITDRNYSKLARAPQSFYLNNIYDLHMKALAEGIDDFIDNCTMMNYYNKRLYMVETSSDNIKITTPNDYYIAKCIFERGDEIDG